MTEKQFRVLLKKYEEGRCSEKEEKMLTLFLDSFQKDIETAKPTNQHKQVKERIFNGIASQIKMSNNPKTIFGNKAPFLLIGVILVIGFVFFLVSWFLFKADTPDMDTKPVIYATLTTGPKERKSILLDDGTQIEINERSTLKYPSQFLPGQNRIVELMGEAFFEVVTDSTRPFIVQTGAIETKVLGTTFGVKAKPEERLIAIALVEGRVAVSNKRNLDNQILNPGEQLTISTTDNAASKSTFKGNLFYAWKEQVIRFEEATVQEVVEVLSEKYKVSFNINNVSKIKSLLVYRVDTQKYRLKDVLNHITRVTDYRFIQNADGSYTVSSK